MQIVEAGIVVVETHPRDKRIMTRRHMWVYGVVIALIGVGVGFWRAAVGADVRSAVLAGLWVVVGTTLMLSVNQVLARRRARRRTNA